MSSRVLDFNQAFLVVEDLINGTEQGKIGKNAGTQVKTDLRSQSQMSMRLPWL